MDTITISYRRRAAARAGAERLWLAAHIEALPDGDVVRRLVAFMGLYARDILHGELPGPYSDTRALTFARLALVDPNTYAAHHAEGDAQLADALGLPVDQIPAVRRDQAHAPAADRHKIAQTPCQHTRTSVRRAGSLLTWRP
jgi:hypothetical protein